MDKNPASISTHMDICSQTQYNEYLDSNLNTEKLKQHERKLLKTK